MQWTMKSDSALCLPVVPPKDLTGQQTGWGFSTADRCEGLASDVQAASGCSCTLVTPRRLSTLSLSVSADSSRTRSRRSSKSGGSSGTNFSQRPRRSSSGAHKRRAKRLTSCVSGTRLAYEPAILEICLPGTASRFSGGGGLKSPWAKAGRQTAPATRSAAAAQTSSNSMPRFTLGRTPRGGNRDHARQVKRLALQQDTWPSVQRGSGSFSDTVQAESLAAAVASWQPLSGDPTAHSLPSDAATADDPTQSRPLRWSDVSNISDVAQHRLRRSSSSSSSSTCDGSTVSGDSSTDSLSSSEAGGSGMHPKRGPIGSAAVDICAVAPRDAQVDFKSAADSPQAAHLHRYIHTDSPCRMVPVLRQLRQPAALQRSSSLPPTCDLLDTWHLNGDVYHNGCALERNLSLPLHMQDSPRSSAAKGPRPRMQAAKAAQWQQGRPSSKACSAEP